MRRALFAILAAVSSLLFVTTAVFWVAGFHWSPSPVWNETKPLTRTHHAFVAGQGALHWDVLTPASQPPPTGVDAWLGVGHARGSAYALNPSGGPNIHLGDVESHFVPFWFVLLLSAVLPACWIIPRLRARFVIPPGHRHCGYDLRTTPERCPECGAASPMRTKMLET